MRLDSDVDLMLRHELKLEIVKLRSAIRAHQIECDDDALYFTLPEVTRYEKKKSTFSKILNWIRR